MAGHQIEVADEDDEVVKLLHQVVTPGPGGGDPGIPGERRQRILQHRGFKAKDQKSIDTVCTRMCLHVPNAV